MAKIRRTGERGGVVTGPRLEAPPADITKIDKPKDAPPEPKRRASRKAKR